MNKKVYIDVGSNLGVTISHWQEFFNSNNDFEVHAFECNPNFWSVLQIPGIILHKEAAWIDNCNKSFYLDETTKSEGSSFDVTKTSGKMSSNPIEVRCIDFSGWLKDNFSKDDYIVLKLNIEGAEYAILEKMIADDTISIIKKLFIWWHYIPYHFTNLTEEQAETHKRVFTLINKLPIIAPPNEGMILLFGNEEIK